VQDPGSGAERSEGGDLIQSVVDAVKNDPMVAARAGTTTDWISVLREGEAEVEALH
jgi:hypothetical protein